MKKMVKMLGLVMGMSLMLCACGNSEGEVAKTEKDTSKVEENKGPVTLSEKINSGEPVIFYKAKSIDKEESPDLYIFEDGKLTIVGEGMEHKTFGELAKMSDEEILEAVEDAKKKYKEEMAGKYDQAIELLEQGKYLPRVTDDEEEIEELHSDEMPAGVSDEEAKKTLEMLKEWEPKGPFKSAYVLNVTTDSSGNYTTSEELITATKRDRSDVILNSDSQRIYEIYTKEEPEIYCNGSISLENAQISGTIYDSFYTGWQCDKKYIFVTRTESDSMGLLLDTPKSEGVEVDKKKSELEELVKKEVLAGEDNQ